MHDCLMLKILNKTSVSNKFEAVKIEINIIQLIQGCRVVSTTSCPIVVVLQNCRYQSIASKFLIMADWPNPTYWPKINPPPRPTMVQISLHHLVKIHCVTRRPRHNLHTRLCVRRRSDKQNQWKRERAFKSGIGKT